jgi:hypothetical protein
MKILFAAIIVTALSGVSIGYSEEYNTIGYIRNACEEFISEKAKPDMLGAGICAGFLMGQAAWRDGACIIYQDGTDIDFFTRMNARNTQGHTLEALGQSFVNWANDHPELWSKKLLFTSAEKDFWSEFPCEAAN